MKHILLPISLAMAITLAVALVTDAMHVPGGQAFMAGLNLTLLFILIVVAIYHGLRLLRERRDRRPGSRLRSKLVLALVAMLMVPSLILQVAANQMVGQALDVWFDVRVDTLLDRALGLAQGFYDGVEADLEKGLTPYVSDPVLLQASATEETYSLLNSRLLEIRQREGWQSMRLFDVNGRLLASSQEGLSSPVSGTLGDNATLALSMSRVVTELVAREGIELALAYAPLKGEQGVRGLMQAEVVLPIGVVQSARAVEADYSSYRELERNRLAITTLFTNMMLVVTLLVLLGAGWAALAFARRLTEPVGELAQALRQVAKGDLDVSVPSSSRDELGALVNIFNRMVARLKENHLALEEAQRKQQQALRNSRERQYILEALLANLQTGVLLLNADGRITLFNTSLRGLMALPSGWIPGKELSDLATARLRGIAEFASDLRQQDSGELQRELQLRVGKRTLHILARGVRLRSAGLQPVLSGFVLVFDDISSLAEAQKSRAWAEVARRLAHEIKNPLTPVKLAAERLDRRFRACVEDKEVFDSCTSVIIGQVERLQRLINDFSILARMPAPVVQPTAIDELLHEMCDLYAAYSQVSIEAPSEPMHCICDADQIKQVLINLLDNGVAATANGGGVRLHATTEGDMVVFHAEDDGVGIPQDHIGRLFEPYFSTKSEGSGLGLAIAQRIAHEHGGEISLLSSEHPTHFCLQLPSQGPSMESK
ncbi:MAG: ATP-binding protein [Mariprofundaceae bacterium]